MINVFRLYDNGTVNCRYDGEYGYIDNAKIVLTNKNPPYFKSDGWYELLGYIWNGFIILLTIIIALLIIATAMLCDHYYKRNMYSTKAIYKLLDSISGLIFCAAIVVIYILCYTFTDKSIFQIAVEIIPSIDHGILYILAFNAYLIVLFSIWIAIIQSINFGANWTIILTTFLVYTAIFIHAFAECISNTKGLWSILGFLVVPLISYFGFMLSYKFILLNRCPTCHASQNDEVQKLETQDMGTTTSHAVETETKKSLAYTETTQHDIYTTTQHKRIIIHCKKCGQVWGVKYSYVIGILKEFKSHDVTKN